MGDDNKKDDNVEKCLLLTNKQLEKDKIIEIVKNRINEKNK